MSFSVNMFITLFMSRRIHFIPVVLLCLQFAYFPATAQMTLQIIVNNASGEEITKTEAFDLSQKEIYSQPFRDTTIFKFNKSNIDCYNIRFISGKKMFRQQVWLDAGNITIKGKIDKEKFVIDTVLGASAYYNTRFFLDSLVALNTKMDTTAINTFLLRNIESNIDNPFSLLVASNYLNINQNSIPDILQLKSYLDKQGNRFSWFLLHVAVFDRLNGIIKSSRLSMPAYRFTNTGNKLSSVELKGSKYYIIDLWFLACSPCVAQHREIKARQRELAANKAEMISISTDKDFDAWKKYLVTHKYTWKNFREHDGKKITTDLGIFTFPAYIIITENGDMIRILNSFDDVLKFLKSDTGSK